MVEVVGGRRPHPIVGVACSSGHGGESGSAASAVAKKSAAVSTPILESTLCRDAEISQQGAGRSDVLGAAAAGRSGADQSGKEGDRGHVVLFGQSPWRSSEREREDLYFCKMERRNTEFNAHSESSKKVDL